MKPSLIVADIEGVITPPNRGMIEPLEILPLIAYCEAVRTGVGLPPLVFCTGRQIPYLEFVAQYTNAFFPGLPSVAENGAFLYDVAQNEVFINPAVNGESRETLRVVRKRTDEIVDRTGARKEYGKEICISLNPPQGMTAAGFFVLVSDELAEFADAINVTHSASAVDITPKGIDKASGVRFLSEKTGIPLEAMLGIGDTRGDLPFLEVVGIAAGPANASAEVRNVAEFIAESEGPAGVAEILRRYTDWE